MWTTSSSGPDVVADVAKDFIHSRPARWFGSVAKQLAKLGFRGLAVLTTTGRRTGLARPVPVAPIRHDGGTYIVSPYGQVGWVHNVRANPVATLRRGRQEREVILTEVSNPEIVQRYYEREPVASRFMEVPGAATGADFASVEGRFPLFRVDEI